MKRSASGWEKNCQLPGGKLAFSSNLNHSLAATISWDSLRRSARLTDIAALTNHYVSTTGVGQLTGFAAISTDVSQSFHLQFWERKAFSQSIVYVKACKYSFFILFYPLIPFPRSIHFQHNASHNLFFLLIKKAFHSEFHHGGNQAVRHLKYF